MALDAGPSAVDRPKPDLDAVPSLARGRKHLPARLQLKPFPRVALQVLEMAARADVTGPELAEVVELDPVLTAKVLRVANSTLYGGQREIATLEDASIRLGTTRIVDMVSLASAGSYFRSAGDATPAVVRFLWQRSLATACATRKIAGERGMEAPTAYTVGLLQNLGQLVLAQYRGREVPQIAERVAAGQPPWEAERACLGYDHTLLSAELLEEWQFPTEIVEVVEDHHGRPRPAEDDPPEPPLREVARQGEALAAFALGEEAAQGAGIPWVLAPEGCEKGVEDLEELAEAVRAEVEALTAAVS